MLEMEKQAHDAQETLGRVVNTIDTLKNAHEAKSGIEKAHPDVICRVISDRSEISDITPHPIPKGRVLLQVVIPEGKEVSHADLMRTWAKSLNDKH